MLGKVFGKFSRDLGIDLGTANTLVYSQDKGIVINEPSIVAINTRSDELIAIGNEARKMLGKTPSHIEVIRPLVEGVISNFEVAEKMLKYFIEKAQKENMSVLPRPRVAVGIPLDITEVERKAVEDASVSAGAREVFLLEEPMAAAIGARLPVKDPSASMILDIGGGTTEIAVISLGGVVTARTLRMAGDNFNRSVIQYVRDHFNLLIGDVMAETVKISIASVIELEKPQEMKIRGRDIISGLPREALITDSQIRDALSKSVKAIIENVKLTLESTPPELVADIYEKGILLTGGGALLKGLDKLLNQATQIPVTIADDPLTCVVRGAGMVIEDFESLKEVGIPQIDEMRIF